MPSLVLAMPLVHCLKYAGMQIICHLCSRLDRYRERSGEGRRGAGEKGEGREVEAREGERKQIGERDREKEENRKGEIPIHLHYSEIFNS